MRGAGIVAGMAAALLFAPQRAAARQDAHWTVAVDVSPLETRSFRELDALGLEKVVMVRLVQDGFAVVAPSTDAEVQVRLRRQGTHLVQSGVHRQRRGAARATPSACSTRIHSN